MKPVLWSTETKTIHTCNACDNVGGWGNAPDNMLRCPRCDKRFSWEELQNLPTIQFPNWVEYGDGTPDEKTPQWFRIMKKAGYFLNDNYL